MGDRFLKTFARMDAGVARPWMDSQHVFKIRSSKGAIQTTALKYNPQQKTLYLDFSRTNPNQQ